jgi:hypothetical protein
MAAAAVRHAPGDEFQLGGFLWAGVALMARLGKHQLELLAGLGRPFGLLVVGDAVARSLTKRGLLAARGKGGDSFFQITPAGLRELADAMERGDLEQFVDPKIREKLV